MAGILSSLNDALYSLEESLKYHDDDDDDEYYFGNENRSDDDEGGEPAPPTPPRLTIVLLVVGTYGDIQPFLLIARKLKEDGHRVRLASHPEYRELVVKQHSLEFFPLGGDPRALSALLVKTGGYLVPNVFTADDETWYSKSFDMVRVRACLLACLPIGCLFTKGLFRPSQRSPTTTRQQQNLHTCILTESRCGNDRTKHDSR